MKLSVVVPVYNSEATIRTLVLSLLNVLKKYDLEVVLVNDGSKDRTWPKIQALALADPRIAAINLARNHGHQLAVTAGLTTLAMGFPLRETDVINGRTRCAS